MPLIAEALTIDSQIRYSKTPDIALVAPRGIVSESSSQDGGLLKAQTTTSAEVVSVLERIALCESQNDPLAKNPNSTASGRFQFLKSSWEVYGRQLWGSTEGKDVFSYKDNTELAEYVFSIEGTKPWESSAYCWKQ